MKILRNTRWTAVGLFGLAALVAMPSAADFVINDDLIVDGSACIGFDCVNGESFGFDTIRIKENNLRIRAFDTSTAASFPSRDWQITFNDSTNGGADKFSIDDIDGGRTPFTIEAAARTNALYVESDGDIGIGTNNPVVDVHIKTGNTPTLRLEQDGSSGFAPQTWDVAGNEANFFIRDVTNGSTLPFRIRPDAPTSAIDVAASGAVVFGGASAGAATTTTIQNTATAGVPDIHVASDANQDALLGLGDNPDFFSGNSDALIFGYNGAAQVGSAFIGTRPTTDAGNAPINFLIENNTEMTLSDTGLNVVDQIRVGGTPLNVPDYVFGEDYRLMPLDELASFVASEKHLPGVPSEAEIKSQGLDLGGFQMRLLEKVEELVRYTLDQQETIDGLARHAHGQQELIDELTARLAALEEQPE